MGRTRSRSRAVLFRLGAVLVGLSPLLVLEGALRLGGVGQLCDQPDPWLEFAAVRPLFVANAATGRYEIPRYRQTYFRPESFPMAKERGQRRVFCLGGSTVQGRPWAIETSFTSWLELMLGLADPDHSWDVVNCGGVSYASYRLVPILQEVLGYEPDLIILCTGHNEFLEDRTYRPVKDAPAWIATTHSLLTRLHAYNAGRSAWMRWRHPVDQRDQLPEEVAARLDYRGGFESYHRDDAWQESIVKHYRFNIRHMVDLCEAAGVPLLLVQPVSNLKDCPPFKFAFDQRLDAKTVARAQELWNQAQEVESLAARTQLLELAVELDPRHAGVQYQLGKCYEQQQRFAAAYEHLSRARDEDLCPLRMIQPLHDALRDVADATGTPLVSAQQLFEDVSPHGLPGKEWLVDHVHPSIHGHQKLAEELLHEMAAQRWVTLRDGWDAQLQPRFQQHLKTLDQEYYERGRERLIGLKRWAQGRAWHAEPPPGHSRLED